MTQKSTDNVQKVFSYRCAIEQLHREIKNVNAESKEFTEITWRVRFQSGHDLKPYKTGQTVYQLRQNLLREYLRHQLRSPSISMQFASS